MDITLGAALLAGLLSFLSPCVLPVVPAYLGQLGILAANPLPSPVPTTTLATAVPLGASPPSLDSSVTAGRQSPWRAMPNAVAFVLGFSVIFTILGAVVYMAAGPVRDNLPLLRQVGGVVLIVLGLNLMGVIRLQRLWRSWKPFERFGGSPGTRRGGVIGGFALGSAFAVGWTPCIGPTLGAILTMAAAGSNPQVVGLLVAYSVGLGAPFLLMALAVDRAPLVTRSLLRYSRQVEVVGGLLVAFFGVALLFDWVGLLANQLSWLWPQV